jgi:hypothetical protein
MPDLEQLRDLGDRLVPPPLDSLRETARTRDRRRRTTLVVASVAAVAAIASFGYLGGLREDQGALEPIQPPPVVSTTRPLTYADGVTVHYGDQAITAAGPVQELDVTDAGVGFRTADGRIWFTDGSAPVELGSVGRPPAPYTETDRGYAVPPGWLVSGNTGTRLAWFDFTSGTPQIVVHDTQTGETVAHTGVAVPDGQLAYPFSIHGDAVYWVVTPPDVDPFEEEPEPTVRLDLTTGVAAPVSSEEYHAQLSASPARTFLVSHAENGFRVGAITEGTGHQFNFAGGRMDPQGAQPIEVHDGLTGEQLGLRAPAGYHETEPLFVVQWLDDHRLVLWQWPPDPTDPSGEDRLLVCPVPTGTCEAAVSGPASIVLPFFG